VTIDELQRENLALKQQIHQLLKMINGFKSERFVPTDLLDQPTLFDLERRGKLHKIKEKAFRSK